MNYIEINGKKYPFIISAAGAKEGSQMTLKTDNVRENLPEMIDQYTKLIHMGLKDGSLLLPFYKRLFHFIPSEKKLQRIIPFEEMVILINGGDAGEDQTEDTEKKH